LGCLGAGAGQRGHWVIGADGAVRAVERGHGLVFCGGGPGQRHVHELAHLSAR
jgi:hypothetical protein